MVVTMVTLAEDLFLLADSDEKGQLLIDPAHLDLGLGGAVLFDLALQGRVGLVDAHVAVLDRTPLGHPVLDKALTVIGAESRAHDPDYWVRRFAKKARRAIEDRLVETGVLRRDDHRVLGIIPVHRTPQADGRVEQELRRDLREAVIRHQTPPVQTAALISLVQAVGIDQMLFARHAEHSVMVRMDEITRGLGEHVWVARAVNQTITALNAALGISMAAMP